MRRTSSRRRQPTTTRQCRLTRRMLPCAPKLAISLYRSGDVDGAIAQLNRSLSYDPKDANSLFDLGMIKLQGKQDSKGALAAWQQLLKTNPQLSADRKATVQKLMASVQTAAGDQHGVEGAREQMINAMQFRGKEWTMQQALVLAVACVALGVAGGWFIHGGKSLAPTDSAKVVSAAPAAGNAVATAPQSPSPAQLKAMADGQAAPLLERLKTDAMNPDLLTAIGNIYYDAQQYSMAVDYYGRSLTLKPAAVSVRTDMATGLLVYMGDADRAIAGVQQGAQLRADEP